MHYFRAQFDVEIHSGQDMLVKLVLTSLLVFLPSAARMPIGAALSAGYLMFTLSIGAFARALDERMQIVAYCEVPCRIVCVASLMCRVDSAAVLVGDSAADSQPDARQLL